MARELALRAAGRQCADNKHLPLGLDQLLLHVLRFRPRAVHLRILCQRSDVKPMVPVLATYRPLTRAGGAYGIFSGRRGGTVSLDRRRRDCGAFLLRSYELLWRCDQRLAIQLGPRSS